MDVRVKVFLVWVSCASKKPSTHLKMQPRPIIIADMALPMLPRLLWCSSKPRQPFYEGFGSIFDLASRIICSAFWIIVVRNSEVQFRLG